MTAAGPHAQAHKALINAVAVMRGMMSDPAVTRTIDLAPEIEECVSAAAVLERADEPGSGEARALVAAERVRKVLRSLYGNGPIDDNAYDEAHAALNVLVALAAVSASGQTGAAE